MAQIRVKTFGKITEIINKDVLDLNVEGTHENFIKLLCDDYPELKNFTFSVAINQIIPVGPVNLKEGDELALLPPFSGG